MSHLFGRAGAGTMPMVAGGSGCYLIDKQGRKYFDGSGGAAVSCLGHGDAEVTAAIKDQLDTIAFAHTGFFTSEPAEELADLLMGQAPSPLDKAYFVSGGSEAVEAALKLARQYFVERGEPQRNRIIARKQSYHGNTLGALAVGGNEWRRAQFAPLLMESSHISPCFEYRGRAENETSFEYGQRVANELEAEIQRIGADTAMAFIAEPVVGATLGAVPAVDGYFKRVREICDQYGLLLILDEVMCGMGRTGSLFACDQDGIYPDILCIAKGLGGGYQPIGAMLCSSQIFETIEQGSGFFQHGHTYLAHPTACAAALAVLRAIGERDLIHNVNVMGRKLDEALRDRFGQHPHIGDIRGRGLFLGLEIVEDRASKHPFDPGKALNKKFKQAAFEAGLICYPMGGTIDGKRGDHILLAPPYIMQDEHVEEIVGKLDQALTQVLQ